MAPRSIGGVRADLHVVADAHAADLRHLDPASAIGREAEAVGTDHRTRMHNAALARSARPRTD